MVVGNQLGYAYQMGEKDPAFVREYVLSINKEKKGIVTLNADSHQKKMFLEVTMQETLTTVISPPLAPPPPPPCPHKAW